MPLATNPKKTCLAWLKSDEEIALAERPVFLCPFLSAQAIDDRFEELRAISNLKYREASGRLDVFLGRGIKGWQNINDPDGGAPLDFVAGDGGRFNRILTIEEKFELAELTLTRPTMNELDAKKSSSSADSNAASSAVIAPADA